MTAPFYVKTVNILRRCEDSKYHSMLCDFFYVLLPAIIVISCAPVHMLVNFRGICLTCFRVDNNLGEVFA